MDFDSDAYRCIGRKLIGDVFLHYFRRHHSTFMEEFKSVIVNTMGIDHTFQSADLITFIDEQGSKKQFKSLFLILNEVMRHNWTHRDTYNPHVSSRPS